MKDYEGKGKVFTGDVLVDFIHQYVLFTLSILTISRRGLNCRHLGFVRECLKGEDEHTKKVSDLVLNECSARAIKNLVSMLIRINF